MTIPNRQAQQAGPFDMARGSLKNPVFLALKKRGLGKLMLLTLAGLAGAGWVFALAFSGVTRSKNPQLALMFMPSESTALAAHADMLFFANPAKPPAEIKSLAMEALRQQAINPRALRLLGYIDGSKAKSARWMQMAERQSRRETGTQLWLIEEAAQANDIQKALYHYNIALRTKPDVQTVLFPRLTAAIDDTDVRLALLPYIRQENAWTKMFLNYAITYSKNLPAVVDLMIDSGGLPDKQANHEQLVILLGQLVDAGYFNDAKRLYLSMAGAKMQHLSSTAFAQSDLVARFGPLGWQFMDDTEAGGGFSGGASSGGASSKAMEMSVFANAASTRPAVRKLLFLKPGSYNFAAKLSSIVQDQGGFLRWQMRCMRESGGSVIWSIDSAAKSVSSTIAVPGDCPVQFLDLIVSGGQGQAGLEATLTSISITPRF